MKCSPIMTERIVVTETKVKEMTGVTLELTKKEAEHLLSVVGSIAGTGPVRETTNSIYAALCRDIGQYGKFMSKPFEDSPRFHGRDVEFK